MDIENKNTKVLVYVIISLWLLFLVGMYAYFDPAEKGWFPRCPFYSLTGLHCPGCGSQRALHQLLRLDFVGALHYNPLLFLIAVMLLYQGLIKLYNRLRPQHPVKSLFSKPIVPKIVLVFVILYWVARNIPVYPFNILAPG